MKGKESDAQEHKDYSSILCENLDDNMRELFSFHGQYWLVSVINTSPGSLPNKNNDLDTTAQLLGHTALLIEGVLQLPQNNSNVREKKFCGFYHVGARDLYRPNWSPKFFDFIYNPYGKLVIHRPKEEINSSVRIRNLVKSYTLNTGNYNTYPARPEHVLLLIISIKDDYHHYLLAEKGLVPHQIYQLSGSKGLFSHAPGSHNCASWCIEKMKKAWIHVESGLIGHAKLVPRKISNTKMQNMLTTFDYFTQYFKGKFLHCTENQQKYYSPFSQHLLLGRVAFICREYDKAINQFKSALSYKPDDNDTFHYLALSHIEKQEYLQGFFYLKQLLEKSDSRGDAWYHQGLIMFIQPEKGSDSPWKKYQLCFAELIKHEKKSIQVFANYGLACIYLWSGQLNKAKKYADAAGRLVEKIEESKRINTLQAWISIEEGQPNQAIEILESNCHTYFDYRALSVAYLNQGYFFIAAKTLHHTIKLTNGTEIPCWNARVRHLLRKNQEISAYRLADLLVSDQLASNDVLKAHQDLVEKFTTQQIKTGALLS